MTLNLSLSYFVWTEEYCQTSQNKNKSPNLWHVKSILVCCIFGAGTFVCQTQRVQWFQILAAFSDYMNFRGSYVNKPKPNHDIVQLDWCLLSKIYFLLTQLHGTKQLWAYYKTSYLQHFVWEVSRRYGNQFWCAGQK